ncbi:MAG: class I SAM-dependent methyltransferase [Nitrososphaera sp.]|nr:class I SAM-dependent methyltransferase [Nitrososphaera sp.]
MNIHNLYSFLFEVTGFRKKRLALFRKIMKPHDSTKILDVGGTIGNWNYLPIRPQITLLNLDVDHDRSDYPDNVRFQAGDALDMPFADGDYDIAYSNSVIEHVHTWERQKRFADEISRVGRRLWVQTPAKEFFLEPHLLTPFVHWLPLNWKRKLLRNFTVWGWITRPTRDQVDEFLQEVRLLTRAEMQALFPNCRIYVEQWLGMSKSYIAYKT